MASAPAERFLGIDFQGFGSALAGINNPTIEAAARRFGEAALGTGRRRIISAPSTILGERGVIDIYTFRDPKTPFSDKAQMEYGLALKELRVALGEERTLIVHTSSTAYRAGITTEWLSRADSTLDSRILWATQDQL